MKLELLVCIMLVSVATAQNKGCRCEDIPPSDEYSCQKQKEFGKCERDYMDGYCLCTCEKCEKQLNQTKPSGVCLSVFDFDDTLKLHTPARKAEDAEDILIESLDLNYGIAIASASCTKEYLKDFLRENFLDGFFNEEFYNSNRFRICNSYKRDSLEDILDYYGGRFECTMFFDDSDYRSQFDDTKLVYTQVKRGVGVTWADFNSAKERLQRQCDCVAVM